MARVPRVGLSGGSGEINLASSKAHVGGTSVGTPVGGIGVSKIEAKGHAETVIITTDRQSGLENVDTVILVAPSIVG